MKIAVIASEMQKNEWLANASPAGPVQWHTGPEGLHQVDVILDLGFDGTSARIGQLASAAGVIVVNSVTKASGLPHHFMRMNGWPGFLSRTLVEIAGTESADYETATHLMEIFGKKTERVGDVPGFVSARIIAMIINEAFFALDQQVSTKEEIDTAMKLGTNYPYGPFAWAQLIGLKNVYGLLRELSAVDARYTPAPGMEKEVLTA